MDVATQSVHLHLDISIERLRGRRLAIQILQLAFDHLQSSLVIRDRLPQSLIFQLSCPQLGSHVPQRRCVVRDVRRVQHQLCGHDTQPLVGCHRHDAPLLLLTFARGAINASFASRRFRSTESVAAAASHHATGRCSSLHSLAGYEGRGGFPSSSTSWHSAVHIGRRHRSPRCSHTMTEMIRRAYDEGTRGAQTSKNKSELQC